MFFVFKVRKRQQAQVYTTLNSGHNFVSLVTFLSCLPSEPAACDALEQDIYKIYGLLNAGG